jgi:MoaA/NifB/PqqE/SkfB family radical SAM enzyme
MQSTVAECISKLHDDFDVLDIIECNDHSITDLYIKIKNLHRDSFEINQRIIFVITKDTEHPGQTLQNLQSIVNDVDISNFFVCVVTTNPNIEQDYKYVLDNISFDKIPFHLYQCQGEYTIEPAGELEIFSKYSSIKNITEKISALRQDQRKLLFENKSFCMLAWNGINIEPDSRVRPCCEFQGSLGNSSKQSLSEIWNSDKWKKIRRDMLADNPIDACRSCYEKEKMGRDTLRKSVNRDLIDNINLVGLTKNDGSLDRFELSYLDIRYNNLCNLTCRSCGPYASSSWYQPAEKLGMIKQKRSPILIAGRGDNDLYDQIIQHVDHVKKIYFAGGEPSMIEKFYEILEILDRRGRNDVHLCYNINMSRLTLKNKSLLDLWRKFSRVSVGASLDGEYQRGEYLRQGLIWQDVIKNRQSMIDKCPHIDFYVSATTSILNVLHLPEFHRSWVDLNLIRPEDFNIQILFNPEYLRVDKSPLEMKQRIKEVYTKHLEWLIPRDPVGRAIFGFRSILNYIEKDSDFDRENFWDKINSLDHYHDTNMFETFPELKFLSKD